MSQLRGFCVLIFLLALSLASHSQPGTEEQTTASEVPAAEAPRDREVELLAVRNALLEEHQSQLISVVTWSLIFAATFLVVISGLLGFLTVNRYSRDKEALMSYIVGLMAKESSALRQNLAGDRKQFEESFDKHKETQTDFVKQTIAREVASFRAEIKSIKLYQELSDAEKWEAKRVWRNAAIGHYHVLLLATELKWEFFITGSLDKMHEILTTHTPKLSAQDISQINLALNKLNEKYAPAADRIRRILVA